MFGKIAKILIAVILGFSGVAQAGLNDGLVAYYPFNGNTDDESGNGNHGKSVGGVSYIPGKFGQAASFDGIDDYIEVPMNNNLSQYGSSSLSVSTWINVKSPCYGVVNARPFWILHWSNCDLATPEGMHFYVGNNNSWTHVKSNTSVSEGWHHWVGVYNGNSLSIYLDGALNNSIKLLGSIDSVNGGGGANWITFGKDYHPSLVNNGDDGGDRYNEVLLDDIRIYNRVVSESEIQELYNEGSAPNEEEPEKLTATLSENLDIHIPVLHYQVNESATANLDVYLSSAPSEDGSLAWKLESFSDTVCSNLVLNSCSNTYTSATAASNETNSQIPFNIHIPAINYLENNYWANLKFAGTQNDSLTWELEDYGASEELFGKEQIARAITRALSKVGQDLAVSELIDSNLAKYSADIIAHVLSYQTLFPITVEDISKIITPLKNKGDLFNQGSKKDYLFLVTDILIEGVKSYAEFKYKDDIGAQKGFVWMTDITYNNIKAAITGNVLDGVISNGKVLYDIGKENYNAYGEYVAITWDVKYSQTFGDIAILADTYQQYYSKSPNSKQHFLDEFESKCLEHKENEGIVFSSDYLLAFNSKISFLCIDYQVKFRYFDENKEGGINYFTSINDESGFITFLERYIHPDKRDPYIQAFEERNGG